MKSFTVKAYGKINIALKVFKKQGEYHPLDSVCVTVKKYDKITIAKRKDDKILLTFYGKYAENNYIQEQTNAYKACKAFIDKYSTCGVNIDIERNIPSGSGMGGSSCDIAGTLNCLKALFKITDDVTDIATKLGSDSTYLLQGGFARLKGRGEKVTFYDTNLKYYVILIYAKSGVNTKDCFLAFDQIEQTNDNIDIDKVEKAILNGDFDLLSNHAGNSLLKPAISLNKEIEENLLEIEKLSPSVYGMTGSGSTVFSLYDSYEMASWAYSRLKKKFGKSVELLETYNPKRIPLIEKLAGVYSYEDKK